MVLEPVRCPHCGSDHVCKHGQTKEGKQRYRCHNSQCARATFIFDYSYQAYQPGVKDTIIDMTLNGSGIRDIARVLKISPTTVIKELKKKNPDWSRSIVAYSNALKIVMEYKSLFKSVMKRSWMRCGVL